MDKKILIIQLLKDNLINTRLLNGLQRLGFGTEMYFLSLPDLVLEIMEITLDDDFELGTYIQLFDKVDEIDIEDKIELEALALEIYDHLMSLKN